MHCLVIIQVLHHYNKSKIVSHIALYLDVNISPLQDRHE